MMAKMDYGVAFFGWLMTRRFGASFVTKVYETRENLVFLAGYSAWGHLPVSAVIFGGGCGY